MLLPNTIIDFLKERNKKSNSPCSLCNSACCNGPGFAILENVLEIYKIYSSTGLKRENYNFVQNLSLSQFVFRYFDRTVINGNFLAFFPKTISETMGLNSVPPWNFWESRDYLLKRNISLGCVFLAKQQLPDSVSNNFCILHNEKASLEITEKPIDCTFLVCSGIRNIQKPSPPESNLWFSLLGYYFPNSVERFKSMCPDIIE